MKIVFQTLTSFLCFFFLVFHLLVVVNILFISYDKGMVDEEVLICRVIGYSMTASSAMMNCFFHVFT